MVYRAGVVEDNKEAREQLCAYLEKFGSERGCDFSVACYGDALAFLDEFSGNFDIIFMDIELPHLNGMDAVRKIREKDNSVLVIFVTNMAQYAVKGYEVNALDFIVKPVQYDGFSMKMDRALERFKTMRDKDVWITERNNKRRLRASAIKYVEVEHHSVIYHTTEGDYTAYDQLQNVCVALADMPFALCNRCFLVNLRYVTAIEEFSVTVDGEQLQISRNKKKSFLTALNEYLGGR